MAIKAVIFDWGGVLIEDPAPGLMAFCAQAWGVTVSDFMEAHGQCADGFQTGNLTEAEFWQAVGQVLDRPLPECPSLWAEAFSDVYQLRPGILDWIRKLQTLGIRTALLSNTEVPVVRLYPGLGYDMFDIAVFSCMEGVAKPDPRIYGLVLQRLEVEPGEAVFFDDRVEFAQGALAVGMSAFLFRGLEQAITDLAMRGLAVSA